MNVASKSDIQFFFKVKFRDFPFLRENANRQNEHNQNLI